MFDARSILDVLVRGGGQQQGPAQGQQSGSDIFRDLLAQLGTQAGPGGRPMPDTGQGQGSPSGRGPQPRRDDDRDFDQDTGSQPPPSGGGLEDILRTILGGGQAGPGGGGKADPGGGPQAGPGGGSLQDILRDLLGGQGAPGGRVQAVGDQGQVGQGGQAGILDALRQVLGQATSGVREGAGRLDQATGASQHAREAIGRATGQSPDELLARLRELVANNQLAAGTALGGLGALVLGTGAGRSLAANAARLGGLALIGGLAYKAYQNYQQGRPLMGGGGGDSRPAPQALLAAPAGSGFEAGAVTHEAATRYIRAMIAAAAADGRIDETEQGKILGGLRQAGIEQAAQQFLAAEINNPASVEALAEGIASPEEAVQVYTAARIAIDLDSDEEHAFLTSLAEALEIDETLAAQVDAAARGTGA
jgi:uncharacterized membrane protein YebE (DUF533 family)